MDGEEIMMAAPGVCYRFDDVVVDPSNLRLTVGGVARQIEPKSFRLLHFLIENRDRAVSKEEILRAVWPDVTVTDNALTRAVAQLRKALEDDPKQPRYIETVPTVGYRFLAEVHPGGGAVLPRVPESRLPWRAVAGVTLVVVVLAAAVALWRFGAHAPEPSISSSVQLTSGDGLDVNGTFSPVGNFVAYASDRSGFFQVYVRSRDASAREIQLTNDQNQNLYPAFSPDGQTVAFSAIRERGIYRVPALGGSVRRLTDFGAAPVWSPDGKWIVFRSHATASLATTDYYWPPDSSLWLVPSDGGEPREIGGRGMPEGGKSFPTWSPDGKEIRFAHYLGRDCSMWAYRMADGSFRKLFSTDYTGFGSATFSSDNRAMYYVSSKLNGDIAIWRQPLDPASLQPAGAPVMLYHPSVGLPRDLSLSPDGKHLAYSAILSDSRLMKLEMNGDSAAGREAESLTHEVSYRTTQAHISGDGRVVFGRLPKSGLPRLWIMYKDGQTAAIGPDNETQYFPHFSGDANSVYYLAVKTPTDVAFKSIRLADGAVRVLAPGFAGIGQPSFAPDGSAVAYHSRFERLLTTWKLDFRTGAKTRLTSPTENAGYARYSRNGKWLALQAVLPFGLTRLDLIPAAGGPAEIIKDGGINYPFSFSPDDSKILYAGLVDGVWNLYWVSIATHEVRQLTHYRGSRTYVRYPDWSPAGESIIFEFNESKGNVFVAELR